MKAVEKEAELVHQTIKNLKQKLESSSMERAVEIARSIRFVKKVLS
jgi:hypothetical protein